MPDRALVFTIFASLIAGALLTSFLIRPSVAARIVSDYDVTPIDPQPVLEPWVEREVTIDARSRRDWVYFDFSRGSVVTDAQIDGRNWDLAFQRYRVATNSGTTNPHGPAGAIRIEGVEPIVAADDGYVVDDWEQGVSHNFAFRRWYRYHPMAAGLVARDNLWFVVRTADGGYAQLKFVSYHCPKAQGGGHGCVTFRYGYRSDFSKELFAP